MPSLFLKLGKNKSSLPIEKITPDITHLEIQAPSLTSIPKVQIDNLISFSIQASSLEEIPTWIIEKTELEVFKIKNSPIRSISNFQKGSKIRILELSNLELDEIPESISYLKCLDTLNLAGNRLSDLPDSLVENQGITRINLDKNQFQILPLMIEKLKKLNHISLEGNPLSEQEKNRIYQVFGIWF